MKRKTSIILGIVCTILLFCLCFQIIYINSLKNKQNNDENEIGNTQNLIEEKESSVNELENNYNTLVESNQDKEELLEGFKKWKQEIEEMM